MSTAADSDSVLHSAGEGVGGFLAGIPPAIGDFFSGVGEGAGVHGMFDWIALIIGIALLVSTIQGLRRGRIVGPMLRGVIAVAFLALIALPYTVLAEGSRQAAEIIVPESHRWAYENWGFAAAVVKDDIVYVSGIVTLLEGQGSYEERYARGLKAGLAEIDKILGEAGSSLDDVVDITTFHTDLARQIETAVAVRMEVMNEPHPAWTAVGTTALAVPDGVTEIKVIAHRSK